jgi:WD40 repeat protein
MLEAGLMPRLEDSCTMLYVRREVEAGLLGTLEKHLAEKCGVSAPVGLIACCKQLEQQHGKPLIVVLDQTEEAYTRGVGDREMEQLAVALDQVFGERLNSPKGKIVLGFRKEYEGEITQALKQYKVDFATVFLQRLSAQGIAEVVNGLTSTEALRKKYGLQIDPALAATIATDLLTDSDTPVSPVLQIILTKLWDTRGQERSFTVEKFLQLKEDGIYLGDFFRQQMTSLHEWEKRTGKDVESSGLALDVLNSHTTDLGFANSRSLDEIRALYHHRKDVIDELIKQFKELYLLTDAGETRNALAHDTLAPVVLQEVQKSDRPAQKALRILASKMANFGKNTAHTYLDTTDLALVEHGEKSMRIWKDQEPELVQKSRERRTTLRRQRWMALGAIALLAVAAAWFAFNSYQSGRIEKWVSQARLEAGTDPTIAMNTLRRAAEAAPGNAAILAAMRDIWSENEFYYQKTTFNAPVLGTLYAPDTTGNWYAWTENCLYRGNRQGMLLDSFPVNDIEAVAIHPKGNAVVVSTRDGQLARLNPATLRQESASRPFAPEHATHLIYSNDGNTLFAAISNGQLAAMAPEDGRVLFTKPLGAAVSALDIHPYQNNLLIGFANGEAGTYTLQGQLQTALPGHRDQVLAFAVSPVDSTITSAGRDAQIIFRHKNGNNRLTIKGHDRSINTLRWTADGQRLLSAGNDYVVKSWSNEGDLIAVYRAHTAFVNQLDLSPDGQHVITAGQDRVVRLWKVASKVTHRFGPHQAGVSGIRTTPDGKQVITTTEAGLNAVGETLNDQDFDFDALLDLQFGQTPRTAMVWDVASGNPLQTWKGHTGGINALDSDATGQSWVTASDDTTARIWSRAGDLQKTLKSTGKIMAAAMAPDGKMVVTATDEGQLTLWNQDATVIKTIHQKSLLRTVAFAANGQHFATGSYDGMVRIYDASGVEKFTIQMPGNQRVESVCFTPDGQSILVGTWGNTASLYSLQGTVEAVLEVYSENKTGGKAIKSVAVSPDGKYLALGAEGGLVHVYQRTAGKPVLTHEIQHHPKIAILSLRFSPDSKGILTGSGDGWGRWWTL